ncbi:MAG: TIGR00730 family Rossman fold protein [Kineosporiaceae bacterium]|jgi:uncharacterized protein (TIGR00730 family)
MSELRRVCVFCGSSAGTDPAHAEAAVQLGLHLAEAGLGLVYGGAAVGLMGVVADAALAAGGEVIGVIPHRLFASEVPHTGLTELHQVPDMHARKALMYDLADAFVVLPGGLGTLEELFEAATWNQLGLHGRFKPIALLDGDGFYAPLVQMLDRATAAGFVQARWRATIATAPTAAEALQVIRRMLTDPG